MADPLALVATYRLQLTPSFGLKDAASIIPYLARLGISHVYTSSYLQAAAGSTHGYDTTDHSRVSAELGGEDALDEFHAALRANGLGNVVDIVPNHVSVANAAVNQRWWNVLRDGPASPDAMFFDIDWDPPEGKLAGKVLLPVLGRDYSDELNSGALSIVPVDDAYEVRYADLRFPVAATTTIDWPADTPGAIHAVLEQQHYRLACWRVGRDELNYRRFFDVTTLAGVRVEDPRVFEAVHERTLRWVRCGDVQGLRVDHPDGLRDPSAYLDELRKAAPDAWIVVEKILEPGEHLPPSWPVDGTTGYDMMRKLTALFVDPAGEAGLTELFESFVGETRSYEAQLIEAKRLVIDELFRAELTRLTGLAADLCEESLVARDFSRRDVGAAVTELLVAMPVYRTYVTPAGDAVHGAAGHFIVSEQDEAVITTALASARAAAPLIDPRLFDFLGAALRGALDVGRATTTSHQGTLDEFVARFQQLSGPAMAKGLEDTLFYRFNRLAALNEVGADPSCFGIDAETFHGEMGAAAERAPLSMSATSTHDTKRSEDVRARIALLSEAADEWTAAVHRWRGLNEPKWGDATPDRGMEYLLYQTMFGSPTLPAGRVRQFAEKAVREAKLRSSWIHPTAFETSLFAFAEALADDPEFQTDLQAFTEQFAGAARIASLAQLTLKAMAPGVPDFYQGSELRTTSLVDPDNRRDVDYAERIRRLDAIDRGEREFTIDKTTTDADIDDDSLKVWWTRRVLQIRRSRPRAFAGAGADYMPLALDGERAASAIAFRRGSSGEQQVVVVAAIRPVALSRNGWGDTALALPNGAWMDALTGNSVGSGPVLSGRVRLGDIAHHGCAVLVCEGAVVSPEPDRR